MPLLAFVRAGAAALARMGMPATLDGEDAGRVHVAHGVRVQFDEAVSDRTVATISRQYTPRAGQALVHPDGTFTLDSRLSDNGVNVRFILRP